MSREFEKIRHTHIETMRWRNTVRLDTDTSKPIHFYRSNLLPGNDTVEEWKKRTPPCHRTRSPLKTKTIFFPSVSHFYQSESKDVNEVEKGSR